MIFSTCSQKSFKKVNLWILWEESHFMFSLVKWNILRQHRSWHRFIWPWLSYQLRNAGGNWYYAGILVTLQCCSFPEQDHPLSHRSESLSFCAKTMQPDNLATAAQHCVLATTGLQLATAATHYSGHIPVLAGIYSHILQNNWKHL